MSCKGLDEQVVRHDQKLAQLEKQFVCVRIVKMDGVDLELFQFDYDQTWCVFFLNSDRTIYGRFGTRAGNVKNATTHISLASFGKAMERALELHRGYPNNKDQLAGKNGPKPEYAVAEKIPRLDKGHCIHCHQVREATIRHKWLGKKLTLEDLWVYPLPENIGLKIDVHDGLRVQSVVAGSPAAKAGIQEGDDLVTLNRQRLISQADIQWVLHQVPAETQLAVTLDRGGRTLQKSISLTGPWKETDLNWRASSGPGLRYGLWTAPLPERSRKLHRIPADNLALVVKNLFTPRAGPLHKAGLRVGDIIVAVDGKTSFRNESQFLTYIRLQHPPGDRLKMTIRRGSKQLELDVPMW